MEYSTYWSILDTPSKTIHPSSVFLKIAIIAGLLWLLIKRFKNHSGDGDKTILLWATAVIAVLGVAGYLTLAFFYPDKTRELALDMLNSPANPKIEGVVSNFERTYRSAKYGN